ncbi:MAG TPA: hypothetical protein VEH27_09825 [Methylomirabilota bacterium]|nr:hypothetical protein [Methylomirabilota bacterium]
MMADNFKKAVCTHYGCSDEQYEERLFWKALYWHAKLPARLFWGKRDSFFKEDLELLRELAPVTDNEVFRAELNRYHGRNRRRHGPWIRQAFGIRVSGRKLLKIKNDLGLFA